MGVFKGLAVGLLLLVAVVGLGVLAGRFGLLQGRAPADLGVTAGRLKPPATTPNSVSSQALLHTDHPMRDSAQIAPLALKGDGPATLARIAQIVQATSGTRVVKMEPDYLYAQYTSALMRFVDDVEFWFDPTAGVVQVRSASRVGHGDRGVNRARVEAIRAALAATP